MISAWSALVGSGMAALAPVAPASMEPAASPRTAATSAVAGPDAGATPATGASPAAGAAPEAAYRLRIGDPIAGSDPVRDRAVAARPRAASLAAAALGYTGTLRVSRGVVFRTFQTTGAAGPVRGYLVAADLGARRTSIGLLHPPFVAARATVSGMANAQRAVAGVNGDFFNVSGSPNHPGVVPTGASNGPEVSRGAARKAAVPDGQRFGPSLPPGTSAKDVIGIGTDGVGRLSRLQLTGTVRAGARRLPLRGLNQFAIPVNGIGAFTRAWGPVPRLRSTCGTDTQRNAPCSDNTAEVHVTRGVVTQVGDTVGAGEIPSGTTVLVGREQGADRLRALRPGDRVRVRYRLASPRRLRFAVGGFPILRDGAPLAGLETVGSAPRTAAGVSRTGRRFYLAVVDGRSPVSAGLTIAELSAVLGRLGADDGVNLDGGGSSTLVLRGPGETAATVRNAPSDGAERAVANGIGVFTRTRSP